MLPDRLRERMKVHFCGPTGANAVDAAIKLCKTATGRGDSISFQDGFHGSSHAAMAVTGLVDQKRPIPNGVPGIHFFPYSYCGRCALALSPDTCAVNCVAAGRAAGQPVGARSPPPAGRRSCGWPSCPPPWPPGRGLPRWPPR
jgi:diaminobutyrate-2-oxoglutarate transaminase